MRHVLHDTGRRVLTFTELARRYPGLVGGGATRDNVRRMYGTTQKNLRRWQPVIAAGPQVHVQAGQFRHSATGQLLRAEANASQGVHTVRASVCEIEAQSGHIRITAETATLPAAAAESELRPAVCLQCTDDEESSDEESSDEDQMLQTLRVLR